MNYESHDVSFANAAAGVTLAGTLTVPHGAASPMPAVVLIAGVGAYDRDYILGRHKLFLTLADYLSQRGIAVLRYDKRGVGASTGTLSTDLTSRDLADDARAGVAYLKTRPEIDSDRIGVIGHSEGGVIASLIASQTTEVAFAVLMAAAVATRIADVVELVAQQLRADGADDALIAADRAMRAQLMTVITSEPDRRVARGTLQTIFDAYWAALPETQRVQARMMPFAIHADNVAETLDMFNSPWYRYYLACDPAAILAQVRVPVLALCGDLDFIAASKITLPIIADTCVRAGNSSCTTVALPGLNHWFQACKTGAIAEYGSSTEALAPVVLSTIADWIKDQRPNRKGFLWGLWGIRW